MKKFASLLIMAFFMLALAPTLRAACSCDASTKYKCKSEDSQGNKCFGTGKSNAEIVFL